MTQRCDLGQLCMRANETIVEREREIEGGEAREKKGM